MNRNLPPSYGSILSHFRNPLVLGGVLLCLASLAAPGQSVSFAGSEETLPFIGLSGPRGVAMDKAGDVFVAENLNNIVVELPMTAAGYGPQGTLPFSGLDSPSFIAVDSAGDVFLTDNGNNRIVELPKTSTGYGPQTTLPANGLINPNGIAVDGKEDVFIADTGNGRVVELPKTGTGYGPQTTLVGDLPHAHGLAVDSVGNLFIANGDPSNNVVELPWTGTGYGPPTVLLFGGLNDPAGIAVDGAGNVFLTESGHVVEVPKTSKGYGSETLLSFIDLYLPTGAAVDSAGDLFVTDGSSVNYRAVEVQIQPPINFGGAYVCLPGQPDPAPCSQSLTLFYNITESGELGRHPLVLGDFAVTLPENRPCHYEVTEGFSCSVEITFTPEAVGARNGAVEIVDSSGNVLAKTTLYGTGVKPPPVAQVSTTYLGFATIPAGDSETLPLTVTNVGGGTLTITPVITGYSTPPPSVYPYAVTSSTCGGGVTFGKSCTLQVQFSPVSAGTHDDILTLQTNGMANPAVNLAGIASASGLGVSGAPLQFGTVPYGSSAVLPLTLTNYGLPGAVTVTAASGPSFTVLTTTQNTCQAGITAGHSCTLPVQFAPNSVGTHNGLLTLTPSSGGAALTAALHGSGSGLGVSAPVLQFGNAVYGFTETLTITNVGLGSITVAAATSTPNYQVVTTAQNTCTGTLAEGQSCALPVEFSPTSPGYHYGTLTLTPSAGAAATVVGLEGTAVALAQSVTFAGTATNTVPAFPNILGIPNGIAVDSAANVFLTVPASDQSSPGYYQAVELPWTALGYGPLTNFAASPYSGAMAVDSAGDIFIADPFYYVAVELPRTGTGYGPQIILPFSGLNSPNGVAVDSSGNVFVSDAGNARVVELPRAGTGYGPQTTVPTGGLYGPIGVDGAGDLFILAATGVVKLPREGTGYGAPATLPFSGLNSPSGIAVDSAGDVFVGENFLLKGDADGIVLELPRVGTGYGPQTAFFNPIYYEGKSIVGVAVDGAGDNLFIANLTLVVLGNGANPNLFGGYLVEVQTHSVNFGSAYLCASGQTPCSTTLTLNFSANDNITLGTPKVLTGGAQNLDFTLASGSTCTGGLAAGSFCSVNVTFSPLAPGTRNGTVEIVDGSGNVVTTVPIYGVGGEPMAQLSTSTLQFGQIGFGTTETLPLTVTNAGTRTLIVLPSINAPSYTITGNTCGAGLAAGKSCTLDVEFSPVAIGTYDSVLTLQNNGTTTPTVALDGIANGLSVGTSPLQFGTVPYGSSEVLPLTITNVGLPGTVTVATKTSDPSYTVLTTAQNTCLAGITAGQNCTLPVKFTPDSESDHTGTLTLTASAEGAVTVVGLGGAGVAGVAFTGATGALPFADLSGPGGIGVDSVGDVFVYDVGNNRVLELPRTSTGFGPQTTLLAGGLQPFEGAGLAVDSARDVFITDAGNYGQVIEIVWTGQAYTAAYAIPIYNEEYAFEGGEAIAQPTGIAVDSSGNIFTTDFYNTSLLELPLLPSSGYGYGNVIGGTTVGGVAVDSAGDVFVADQGDRALLEVPNTPTGYGSQTSLPFNGAPNGVAVDNAGNLFVAAGDLVELPKVGTGYGPQTTLLTGSFANVATDSAGNVYVTGGNGALELQRTSPNFGTANICAPGATTPVPCSQTLTFNYSVNSNVGFGTPKILTGGKPNLDFTLAPGSTCTGTVAAGSFCTVNVTFAPLAAGTRNGVVEIVDTNGNVRSSTPVSGLGVAPPNTTPVAPRSGAVRSHVLRNRQPAHSGAERRGR